MKFNWDAGIQYTIKFFINQQDIVNFKIRFFCPAFIKFAISYLF